MTRKSSNFPVNGTTALKAQSATNRESSFRAFNTSEHVEPAPNYKTTRFKGTLNRIGNALIDTLLSSEMACSLKIEDFRGVSYDRMTRGGVAVLSVGCSVIGVLAIIVGA